MRAGACARVPASGVSHAVPGPSSRCDACAFRGAHRTRWRLVSARSRLPRRAPGGVRATTAESNDTGLAPRVFDDVEDIRNRSSSDAERTNQREALALAVLASTRALDPSSANGFQQLTDAASFVGWRVISLEDGSVIGEVRHALAMAGGEVVAQMGDLEMDEHDLDDELGVADLFSPAFAARGDDAAFDDRDDDEDDWDETEESSGSFDDDSDDDWEVIYEGEDDGATSSSDVSSSDDFSVYSSGSVDENNTPPLSLVLRIRGERFVEGAGGVVNVEPVAHLVPLVPSMFPRWNEVAKVLALDAPSGLLDLGFRRSEIRALRRDLSPYTSHLSATQQGMPKRLTLVRAGRNDLVTRVTQLGDWSSVALALGLESKRKPDGYWENIDFLREALLQLVNAFWFEETEKNDESGELTTFWYNDVSGALSFTPPDPNSGGGLDQPVMPAMSDVLEARRWDVHQAILLHGGYKEVSMALGWLPKRTSENRHLLQFSALHREMESFITETGEDLKLPQGRFPSETMLLDHDREDLVQGVRWHGGFIRCARRMGRVNFSASTLGDAQSAARALRTFADETLRLRQTAAETSVDYSVDTLAKLAKLSTQMAASSSKHARLLDVPLMPTERELLNAGRHDLRWALRIHDRDSLTRLAGVADPNKPDPVTGKARKMRLQYAEARKFMRNTLRPRLASAVTFRKWSATRNNRPWFIPADPQKYYEVRGTWVGWEDFLGVEKPPGNPQRVWSFRGYNDAKKYMRTLRRPPGNGGGVSSGGGALGANRTDVTDATLLTETQTIEAPTTSSAYKRWASSGNRPVDIPRDPAALYRRRNEWVSWDDFLGRPPGQVKAGRRACTKNKTPKNSR